jgi:hypothetical protein
MANDVRIILSAEDRTKATIEGMIGRLGHVSSAGSLASNALRGLTAALSVGALIASTRATIDHADALNDMAERTGLAGDKLSELEYAARLNGASLEDVESGLKKLSVKALDAAQGGKQAAAMFAALGVAATAADGSLRNSDELMTNIAAVLNQVEDRTLRTALAVEVFGKSGDKLIPLFENMQASRQEAQRLGAVIGVDFQKSSAQFNDDLDRMILMSRAFGVNLANEVLPTLQRFITELLAGRSIFGGYWEAAKNIGTTNPFATPAENAETYRNKLQDIKTQLIDLEKRGPEMDRNMGAGYSATQTKKLNDELRTTQRLVEYFQRINGQTSTAGAGRGSVNPPSPNAANGAGILARLRAANTPAGSASGKAPTLGNDTEELRAYAAGLAELDRIAASTAAKTDNLSKTQEKLRDLMASPVYAGYSRQQREQLAYAASLAQAEEDRASALDAAVKSAQARQTARNDENEGIRQFIADQEAAAFATAATAEATAAAARAELDNFGKTQSQLAEITLLRLQDKQVNLSAGTALYAATQRQIEAQKELIATLKTGEARDAGAQSAQDRQAARNAEFEGIRQFIADQETAAQTAARTAQATTAAAQAEFDAFGKTKSQLAELTLARLQDSQVNLTAGSVAYDATQRQIEAQQQLIGILKKGELRDAAIDAADKAQQAWRQTADSINASLTDALLRGFESGKDFGQNFADTLENMLKTAILRPLLAKVLDPISMAVSTGITSLLGFEGGGYTGAGLRTGGLDGRGGFMAMLHPNETVIDHTQGGSAGAGPTVTVVQNFTVGDVASVSLVRQAVAGSERRIAASIGRSMNYGGAIA